LDVIRLKGLRFFGYHGVYEEEKTKGQEFIIDVEIFTPTQGAGSSDVLSQTVNYAEVYKQIKDIVENQRFDLIEALAQKIADTIKSSYEAVNEVIVKVKKPQAPIGGPMDYVEIEIKR
jgi:dihydroneopterin aldolase